VPLLPTTATMVRRDSFEPIEPVTTRLASDITYNELPKLSSINLTKEGVLEFVDHTGTRLAELIGQRSWRFDICMLCLLLMIVSGYKLWSSGRRQDKLHNS
jgi:hypothetical protein